MNSVGLFFAVICVITVAVYCKPAPDPPNSVLVGEAFLTVDGQDTLYQYTLYPPADGATISFVWIECQKDLWDNGQISVSPPATFVFYDWGRQPANKYGLMWNSGLDSTVNEYFTIIVRNYVNLTAGSVWAGKAGPYWTLDDRPVVGPGDSPLNS